MHDCVFKKIIYLWMWIFWTIFFEINFGPYLVKVNNHIYEYPSYTKSIKFPKMLELADLSFLLFSVLESCTMILFIPYGIFLTFFVASAGTSWEQLVGGDNEIQCLFSISFNFFPFFFCFLREKWRYTDQNIVISHSGFHYLILLIRLDAIFI